MGLGHGLGHGLLVVVLLIVVLLLVVAMGDRGRSQEGPSGKSRPGFRTCLIQTGAKSSLDFRFGVLA